MKRTNFNKLVRDYIPGLIAANGEFAAFRETEGEKKRQLLFDKLNEEVEELIQATETDKRIEELADVWEVLDAIAEYYDIPSWRVMDAQIAKREDRGGFSWGVELLYVDTPEDRL